MIQCEKVYGGPFLWQSKLFLRICTVSFIYLWVSSGVFRRVRIAGISLQPSVFRLHVALIDFSPSLLKCTVNQYSNKSSFILEKCSFQPSGQEVLVLSVWSAFGLGPHLPNNCYMTVLRRHDTTTTTTTRTYIINVQCKHNRGQQRFKCVVSRCSCGCFSATLDQFDVYIVFSPSHSQWQLYSAWGQSPGKGSSGLYEAVFSQGHTFNVKQWPKVFSIHHCQDFYFVCPYRQDRVKLFADGNSIQQSKDVTFNPDIIVHTAFLWADREERDTSSILFLYV